MLSRAAMAEMAEESGYSFAHVARCADLSADDLEVAGRSQEACAALLARMAQVSAPGTGAAGVLWLFSSLASPLCTWLEGDLAVELFEEDDGLRVRVLEDLGHLRECVLPPVTLRAPLEEIIEAAEDIPERLGALRLDRVSSRCVLLLAAREDETFTAFEISETCLSSGIEHLDRGWDA